MCGFYEVKSSIRCSDDVDVFDDEKEDEWNGCCEDPYDDEEDNEREWCD